MIINDGFEDIRSQLSAISRRAGFSVSEAHSPAHFESDFAVGLARNVISIIMSFREAVKSNKPSYSITRATRNLVYALV